MNRREFFSIGLVAPFPELLLQKSSPAQQVCEHNYLEWYRTAAGDDRTKQCTKCGEKLKMKMKWEWGERSISDWIPDGRSDPKWIRDIYRITLP